jgi:hypothetical protein
MVENGDVFLEEFAVPQNQQRGRARLGKAAYRGEEDVITRWWVSFYTGRLGIHRPSQPLHQK